MKTYKVNVKRTEWGWVEAEAKSKKQAKIIAENEKFLSGMIHWMSEETEVESVEEI